jgi:hypothetical protein
MAKINDISFEELRDEFRPKYETVKTIESPALHETVHFNALGMQHLFYAGNRSPRLLKNVQGRIACFERAVKIIQKANLCSGYQILVKNGVNIHYWEFICVMDDMRVKVVLRRLKDGGQLNFYSMMPCWRKNPLRMKTAGCRMDDLIDRETCDF